LLCFVDARLLESSESYKAASQRASLEVEKLRVENEDLKQQLDAGSGCHGFYCTLCTKSVHKNKLFAFILSQFIAFLLDI